MTMDPPIAVPVGAFGNPRAGNALLVPTTKSPTLSMRSGSKQPLMDLVGRLSNPSLIRVMEDLLGAARPRKAG